MFLCKNCVNHFKLVITRTVNKCISEQNLCGCVCKLKKLNLCKNKELKYVKKKECVKDRTKW